MEEKKSYKADLEHMRPTWFLAGVALVLALMYAALEYTTTDRDYAARDLTDDAMADLELLPALDRKDMVAARPQAQDPAAQGRIKPVEKAQEQMRNEQILTDLRTVGEASEGGASETSADANTTQALSPVAVDEADHPLPLSVLEQYPEFPGGVVELMKWLNQNLKYPDAARRNNIQGRVVVAFVINRDGSVSGAHVSTSVHPLLDREALRVVRLMPRWKPGEERGKPCRTMFVIPINFRL